MDIRLSSRARKYLQDKEASELTLYLVDIEAGSSSIGVVKDVGISLNQPKRPEQFLHDRVEGLDIYVDRKLKITGPIVIKKQGVWKFASLFADGLHVPI